MKTERYGAIDGLKTIACIGIVMMHVRANSNYMISGFIYEKLIPSFTDFVFLFMVISAFGMCCGYFDRVINNQISLEDFYKKRYSKILPFFVLLVLVDVVISPSKAAFIEGFADVTLLFGLFPNNISVIGVGWFLGLIFAFYCVLLKSEKRAWGTFVIALVLNFCLRFYFNVERNNIAYDLCYFLAGGLVYLYRKKLEEFSRKYWYSALAMVIVSVAIYFGIGSSAATTLLISVTMLIYALGNSGGAEYCKTSSLSFSVPLVWKCIFHTWLSFV